MPSTAIRTADAKRKHLTRYEQYLIKLPATVSWWTASESFEQFSERARQEYPRMATRARAVSDHSVLE
jgi:hypothetical protein